MFMLWDTTLILRYKSWQIYNSPLIQHRLAPSGKRQWVIRVNSSDNTKPISAIIQQGKYYDDNTCSIKT